MENQEDIKKIEDAYRKDFCYLLVRLGLIDVSGSFYLDRRNGDPFFYMDLLPSVGLRLPFISTDNRKMEKQVKTLEYKLKSNVEK